MLFINASSSLLFDSPLLQKNTRILSFSLHTLKFDQFRLYLWAITVKLKRKRHIWRNNLKIYPLSTMMNSLPRRTCLTFPTFMKNSIPKTPTLKLIFLILLVPRNSTSSTLNSVNLITFLTNWAIKKILSIATQNS